MQSSSPRRSRNARWRKPVMPARFAAVVLRLPENTPAALPAKAKRRLRAALALVGAALAAGVWLHLRNAPAAPAPEDVFVFGEISPPETPPVPRDPSPPPPEPEAVPDIPPPQFGLQAEALSEAGDMAVATGNTLMTEADSVVKAPVEALPAAPTLIDQAPRILKGTPPEYPARALERNLEGTVVVLITIDTLGRVTQADIEKSGGREFDPDVLRSVRALVFQPPVRNGKRMAARFRQPYEFRLE